MIQHAFTGAYTSEVSARNQGIKTITSGVKDAATLIAGTLGLGAIKDAAKLMAGPLGLGTLGDGALSKGAGHALAGRVGGVGGNIMLATLEEKKDTARIREETNRLFSAEEVGQTIQSQLGDNPINRSAKKSLGTVFETLANAKIEGLMSKKGQIQSSMGEIDPNSELGKKIISNLDKEDKE